LVAEPIPELYMVDRLIFFWTIVVIPKAYEAYLVCENQSKFFIVIIIYASFRYVKNILHKYFHIGEIHAETTQNHNP
jgi:hypothetical protein